MINKKKLRSLHRYSGIVAAIFIVFLTVTGILLNHTGMFKLDKNYLHHPAILSLYDIKPIEVKSYHIDNQWINFDSLAVYFNTKPLTSCKNLTGVIRFKDYIVISCETTLLLLGKNGNVIEIIDTNLDLPVPLIGLSSNTESIFVHSPSGIYSFDPENIEFVKTISVKDSNLMTLSNSSIAPNSMINTIINSSTANSITVEHLLLDIHTGRIFGTFGILIIDAAALILLFMAASGLYIWLKK